MLSVLASCEGCFTLSLRLPALEGDLVEVVSFCLAVVWKHGCSGLGSVSDARPALHLVCFDLMAPVEVEEREGDWGC